MEARSIHGVPTIGKTFIEAALDEQRISVDVDRETHALARFVDYARFELLPPN